ncbi:MAG: DUF748 domain-containing protein [Pseudomonadota bacterium]
MKKTTMLRRLSAAGAALLALYAGIGFLALPAIVKRQAVQLSSDQLHRHLSIDTVQFNPFTLALTVRGLKLMEPRGGAVFASFNVLALDLAGESLWRLAPVVQQLRLDQPYLHLVRSDANRYNIDDILDLVARQPPSPEPARYSLNNVQISGGRIAFDDQPARSTHLVADLKLGVPFMSTMPADVQVFVEPLLSARVDGAPLLIKGKARPFADRKELALELDLDDVDLPRYLDYLPFQPNFKLPGARLSAKLTASLRQPKGQNAALVLGGSASLKGLEVTQADGKPVLKLATLDAQLGSLDVFAGRFDIARLGLEGLQADVSRDRNGVLNLDQLMAPERAAPVAVKPGAKPAAPAVASAVPSSANTASSAVTAAPSAAQHWTLKELDIRNAALRYADPAQRAVVEKFDLSVRDLAADTGKKTVTIGDIASSSANIVLHQGAQAAPLVAPLAAPVAASLSAPSAVPLAIKEVASASASASQSSVQAPLPAAAQAASAAPAGQPYLVSVARIALQDWSVQLEDRSRAEPVSVTFAPFALAVQDMSTAPAARSKVDLKATINRTGQLAASGTLGLAPFDTDLALELTNIGMLPLQPYATEYVNLRLTQAAISAKGRLQLSTGSDGVLAGGYKGDASVNNLATVDKTSANDFLSWKSLSFGAMDVRLQPFAMSIETVALADFFARVIIDPNGRINVQDIQRNAANEDRSLTEANARARSAVKADKEMAINSAPPAAVSLAAASPAVAPSSSAPSLAAAPPTTAPSSVTPSLTTALPAAIPSSATPSLAATSSGAVPFSTTPSLAVTSLAAAPSSAAPPSSVASPKAAPSAAEALPPIRIGTVTLSGGRVRFTDNFIKPNYTASLKELGGTISGLSSDAGANASVALRGAVNGAPLSIAGRVNPLKRDLFLDVKADVRGMELAALSAYADKYVGYGIEKGKLSFEVAYLLDQRRLTAENHLMLDQLTFGEESSNPQATKLPVRLAVALLSDRNGVIDLRVPVGGLLDDPQFSFGGVILGIIGNAISKTVTAPFALLGSLFGGGETMSTMEFDAGHAAIPSAGEAKLASLAKALTERPGLKLDITGRVDPASDTEALKRVALERKVRALKARDLQTGGDDLPDGGVKIKAEEYPALLARAFQDEPYAKPRNALGLPKSLTVDEMEKLMLANVSIGNDDLIALGRRRSQAAKDWLTTTGQVAAERLFIVSARLHSKDDRAGSAGSLCRVDYALR